MEVDLQSQCSKHPDLGKAVLYMSGKMHAVGVSYTCVPVARTLQIGQQVLLGMMLTWVSRKIAHKKTCGYVTFQNIFTVTIVSSDQKLP